MTLVLILIAQVSMVTLAVGRMPSLSGRKLHGDSRLIPLFAEAQRRLPRFRALISRYGRWRPAMRIYQRLREKLGFRPLELDAIPGTADHNAQTSAPAPSASESMCCGHCSGKAEGPSLEQPRA
jgi:hypothetical protein